MTSVRLLGGSQPGLLAQATKPPIADDKGAVCVCMQCAARRFELLLVSLQPPNYLNYFVHSSVACTQGSASPFETQVNPSLSGHGKVWRSLAQSGAASARIALIEPTHRPTPRRHVGDGWTKRWQCLPLPPMHGCFHHRQGIPVFLSPTVY